VLTPADYHATLVALFVHGSTRAAALAINMSYTGAWLRLKRLQVSAGPIIHRPARSFSSPILSDLGRHFIYETIIASDGLHPGPALIARLKNGGAELSDNLVWERKEMGNGDHLLHAEAGGDYLEVWRTFDGWHGRIISNWHSAERKVIGRVGPYDNEALAQSAIIKLHQTEEQ
jgi:hypothetical protein